MDTSGYADTVKRFLRFLIGLIGGLIAALGVLLLLIYLSREKLIAWVITEIGNAFAAKVQIQRVEVGSLRALPNLGIRLQGFLLRSKQGDTLFSASAIDLHLNLWEALVKENYRIHRLELEAPRFWLLYDKKGHTPWEGVFQTSSSTPEKPSPWALEKVRVRSGRFIYADRQADFWLLLEVSNLHASIEGLGDRLQIIGTGNGALEKLYHRRKTWLAGQPFALQGMIQYEADWLLASPLRIQLLGLFADLQGGIRLSGIRPDVSLRIADLDLDLSKIRTWWQEAPPVVAQLGGALRGEGDILGPVGRGKLPRIRLRAALDVREPLTVEGYVCQALHAQGQLRWYPDLPAKSVLEIDTLFFSGGESDTLHLRGSYSLQSERLFAAFYIHTDLAHLHKWRIPYTGELSGRLHARGQLSYTGKRWMVSGEGTLSQVTFPDAMVDTVAFRVSPERLEVTNLRGRYGELRAFIPTLSVGSYARLWDTTAAPLHLQGKVRLPAFSYAPVDTGRGSALPWTGELDIQIDTFYRAKARYGPVRARIRKAGDTLHIREAEIHGIGGGYLVCTGLYSPTLIEGEGTFQRIDLARLHEQTPELDTLFPLLKHMRGQTGGRLTVYLPLRQGSPAWAGARGELTLILQNILILESPYTYELFSLIPLTDFKRIEVGQVQTRLTLSEGVLRTDTTWLRANRWNMRIAGAHTLQGELSYDLLVEVPRVLLDKSIGRVENLVQETEGERLRLSITVTGTTDRPRFAWKPAGRSRDAEESPAAPTGKEKKRRRSALPVHER